MNKNMKRVLSLVLAFVMVIGMMVPSFAEEAKTDTVNKKAFTMKVKDEFDNVLGKNPATLEGELSVKVKTRTAGSSDAFANEVTLTADSTGLFTIDPLAKSTDYEVTVNVAGITVKGATGSAYYVGMDDQDPAQPVYAKTFTFSTDENGNITGNTYVGMYTFPVKSMSGTNNFENITKYFIQVNRINPENKSNRLPVKDVPVKLYKAEFKDGQYVAMMGPKDPVIELQTSSDKDGQVVIEVEKNMVADKKDPKKMVWDGKIFFNGDDTVLFDNGQLFMAVTEDTKKDPTSSDTIPVEEMKGLVNSQALIDLWQFNGKDRVFNKTTGQLVKPNVSDRRLDLKSEARQWDIVLQNKMVNIVVKVFNNGVTPAIRKPIEGAEIALYNVVGPEVAASKVKDSDFSEIAKAKTNAEGMVVFSNVDWTKAVSYWMPDAANVLGMEKVQMPYAIKQLSAPEGVIPYADYIMMDGYFANGDYSAPGKSLVVGRYLDGNDLIIEIENHADAFNYEGRIFGKDRYATAVEIAKKAFPNGLESKNENFNRKTVVLAQGHQFSDALVAGPVAEVSSAPILLTAQNSVPAVTLEYLVANGVEQVIIMGGSNTVSDAVIATLNKAVANGGAGVEHIVRIEGKNRYATAVEAGEYILKAIRDDKTPNSRFDFGFTDAATRKTLGSMVFVANGLNFADALTASVPAAGYGAPILLTDGNKVPAETAQALRDWKIANVYIVGGEKSVSANEFAELAKVSTVRRLAGADRTETSLAVAKKFLSGSSHAYFANGMKAADALTGVVLGVKDRAPIILVSGNEVSESVVEYINNSQLTTGTILGGPNSISAQLREALSKQINLKK